MRLHIMQHYQIEKTVQVTLSTLRFSSVHRKDSLVNLSRIVFDGADDRSHELTIKSVEVWLISAFFTNNQAIFLGAVTISVSLKLLLLLLLISPVFL